MISLKSAREIEILRGANVIVAEILQDLESVFGRKHGGLDCDRSFVLAHQVERHFTPFDVSPTGRHR